MSRFYFASIQCLILSKSNQVVQVALYRLKAKEKKPLIHKDQESTDTTKVRQTAVQLKPRKKTH